MGELNCEVIRDLLPSYLDGICSKSTETLVEEHLGGCAACKAFVEEMRGTAVVPGRMEPKQIDYMKKIRLRFGKRCAVGFGALAVFLACVAVYLGEHGVTALPPWLCYVGMPIWMASAYAIFTADTSGCGPKRGKTALAVASLILIGYVISLMLLCFTRWVAAARLPFGLRPEEIGPFVAWQLIFCIAAQIIIFAVAAWRSVKTGDSHGFPQNLAVVGSTVGAAMLSLLGRMATAETILAAFGRSLALILAEGTALLLLFQLMERRRGGRRDGEMSCGIKF